MRRTPDYRLRVKNRLLWFERRDSVRPQVLPEAQATLRVGRRETRFLALLGTIFVPW